MASAALLALAVLQACSPLTVANTVFVGSGMVSAEGVRYGEGPRRQLDVYAPDDAHDAPVVVFFYGGSWRNGERAHYRFVGDTLARRGIVTVIPDYRVYPEVRFPAFVEDGAEAVRWAGSNIALYGGDPDRLVLVGHSAGAHIAALLALDPNYLYGEHLNENGAPASPVRGVVGMAGPYGFDLLTLESTRPIFEPAAGEPELAIPVSHVTENAPPMVLLHGEADETVAPENTAELADALRNGGVGVQTITYPGVGHIRLLSGLFPIVGVPARVGDDVIDAVIRLASPQPIEAGD
ncbi:alpha/beta hydrolase [Fodinicurvata sp. EGI_FJ10296]|uniref:alpha/beta hydrolase n=1 Tax=Fodinicurvata sp. EGI_FJ10296 TaxID=3231908 RepID=UPI0034556023